MQRLFARIYIHSFQCASKNQIKKTKAQEKHFVRETHTHTDVPTIGDRINNNFSHNFFFVLGHQHITLSLTRSHDFSHSGSFPVSVCVANILNSVLKRNSESTRLKKNFS